MIDNIEQQPPVRLSQWLENQFEADWYSVESHLAKSTSEAPRVGGAKMMDLGSRVDQPVTLFISLTENELETGFLVTWGCTATNQGHLPDGLSVTVVDEGGEFISEGHIGRSARRGSKGIQPLTIQASFRRQRGDRFSIKLDLGEVTARESFVI